MGTFTYKILIFASEALEATSQEDITDPRDLTKEEAEDMALEMGIGDFGAEFCDFRFNGEKLDLYAAEQRDKLKSQGGT